MKFFESKWFPLTLGTIILFVIVKDILQSGSDSLKTTSISTDETIPEEENWWVAPPLWELPGGDEGNQIKYGRALIANTSNYFGPKGIISSAGNGMNCQNCHLEAGTKPWGNNYSAVYSTYPRFRERSGGLESIPRRINDCLQRSLNSEAIDSTSKEMQAIIAYMKWIGQHVKKGEKPKGAGITELSFLNRPADPEKGKKVFIQNCQRCHGANGQGEKDSFEVSYIYPPLWGPNSYTTAAGLFRLSRFAGYVKDNMPWGASHHNTQLSDEEAWDVAAFVNSQPRPIKIFKEDWPNIAAKPFDHPFGPYSDGFSEEQHKFGPFIPIIEARKKQVLQKKN
jgi:thiosulfate dehydrogenase